RDQAPGRAAILWAFGPRAEAARETTPGETPGASIRALGNTFDLLIVFFRSIGSRFPSAQAPRRKDHLLAAFRRSAQDRFHAADEGDHRRRVPPVALGRDDQDRLAFLQIGQGRRGHPRDQLLEVPVSARGLRSRGTRRALASLSRLGGGALK